MIINIGYWKTKDGNENLPMPVEDSIKDVYTHSVIIEKLLGCFKVADKSYTSYVEKLNSGQFTANLHDTNVFGLPMKVRAYRGYSKCRLCGCNNGSKELEITKGDDTFKIPEGYLHYLIDHFVGIDERLVELFA